MAGPLREEGHPYNFGRAASENQLRLPRFPINDGLTFPARRKFP